MTELIHSFLIILIYIIFSVCVSCILKCAMEVRGHLAGSNSRFSPCAFQGLHSVASIFTQWDTLGPVSFFLKAGQNFILCMCVGVCLHVHVCLAVHGVFIPSFVAGHSGCFSSGLLQWMPQWVWESKWPLTSDPAIHFLWCYTQSRGCSSFCFSQQV